MKIVTRLLLLAGAFFLSIGTAPSFASCDPYPTLDRFKGTLPHVPGAVSFLLDTEHTLVFLAAYNATPPLTSATADAVFIHGIPTAPKALFAVVSDGCVMGYELAPVRYVQAWYYGRVPDIDHHHSPYTEGRDSSSPRVTP